jgi:hypothetical protein
VGRKYLRCIGDCVRLGVVLEVTCPGCGKIRYLTADQLIGTKLATGTITPETRLGEIEPKLRCRGRPGAMWGCGLKGGKIRDVWPDDHRVPAGVPVVPFLNADDRERERMIRKARG